MDLFGREASRARIECEQFSVDAVARRGKTVYSIEERGQEFVYFGSFKVLRITKDSIACGSGLLAVDSVVPLDRLTSIEISETIAAADYLGAYVLALNYLSFELEKELRCAADIGNKFEIENKLNVITRIKQGMSDGTVVAKPELRELPGMVRTTPF